MSETIEVDLKDIKDAINVACGKLTTRHYCDREWTQEIFLQLSRKVPDGVYCCCGCSRSQKRANCYAEWLYDMTWYTENSDHRLNQIVLVLESEWSSSKRELQYDFEKLLQAKCKTKVFICQAEKAKGIVMKGISAYAEANKDYNGDDERYLLAIYRDSDKKFYYFDGKGKEI